MDGKSAYGFLKKLALTDFYILVLQQQSQDVLKKWVVLSLAIWGFKAVGRNQLPAIDKRHMGF